MILTANVGQGAPPPPKAGRKRGYTLRIGRITHVFDYLPPFTLIDMYGVKATVCGKCFQKLPDDPFNGKSGQMLAGAVRGSKCVICGKGAYPYEFS